MNAKDHHLSLCSATSMLWVIVLLETTTIGENSCNKFVECVSYNFG